MQTIVYAFSGTLKMDNYICAICVLSFLLVVCPGGDCHGRLVEPPSRASMWRFGYKSPENFADNQMFCGGYTHQWQKNGGRCGICGDPWDDVREHEAGGKYAKGIIVRRYQPANVILVIVELSAAHLGYFEFRICPNNNPKKRIEQTCLDRHVLELADDSGSRYYITDSTPQNYEILLKLPDNMECSQCLIQWMYHTGNSWGQDGTAPGCLGCGPQEEFYGCADVAIGNMTMFDEEYYVMVAREIEENKTKELEAQKVTETPPSLQGLLPSSGATPRPRQPYNLSHLLTGPPFQMGANDPSVPLSSEKGEENKIDDEVMDFLNVMWQTMFQTIQAQLREYGGVFTNTTLPTPPDFRSQFPELQIQDGDDLEFHIKGKEQAPVYSTRDFVQPRPYVDILDSERKQEETDFANSLMKATAERENSQSWEEVEEDEPEYLPNHIARSITTPTPPNEQVQNTPVTVKKRRRRVKIRRPKNPSLKFRKRLQETKTMAKPLWFDQISRAVNPNYNPEEENGKEEDEVKGFLGGATTHATIQGTFGQQ